MSTTLSNTILSIMRRRHVKGLTVGEIFDRIYATGGSTYPTYSSVRARVYELANDGKLYGNGVRKDTETGRTATTFVRPQQ
jgi:hypothetical protein